MDIQDLAAPCGMEVIPGNTSKLYIVCACNVTTFPPFVATAGIGDKLQLDGDIVLAAGKKFATIDITPSTGEIVHAGVGVRGSRNFTNKYDFETPKSLASDEWFDQNANGCFVVIVEQKDGQKRVFGNVKVPAFMETSEGKGGKGNADPANWVASLMDETGRVAPYYTGAIDTTV